MAVVREHHCYRAPVRAYLDGPQNNKILWYKVPDDRPFYTGLHTFWPRQDDFFSPSGGEYELYRVRRGIVDHYSGVDYWGAPGTHVDGDPEDFLGLATIAKYPNPTDPCFPGGLGGYGFIVPAKIGFGVSLIELKPELKSAGLELGAFIPAIGLEILKAGIEFGIYLEEQPGFILTAAMVYGASTVEVPPLVEHVTAGISLAASMLELLPDVEQAGIEIAALTSAGLPVVEFRIAGLVFAGEVFGFVPALEILIGAIEFGDVLALDPTPPDLGPYKSGIELGGVVIAVAPSIEAVRNGIELAGKVFDVSPGPGTSCATALVVGSNTNHTYATSVTDHQWYVEVGVSGSRTVQWIGTPASAVVANIYSGASCASLTLRGQINNITTSLTFTILGPLSKVYAEVLPDLGAPHTYTINLN